MAKASKKTKGGTNATPKTRSKTRNASATGADHVQGMASDPSELIHFEDRNVSPKQKEERQGSKRNTVMRSHSKQGKLQARNKTSPRRIQG